jgi:hypothetical protein
MESEKLPICQVFRTVQLAIGFAEVADRIGEIIEKHWISYGECEIGLDLDLAAADAACVNAFGEGNFCAARKDDRSGETFVVIRLRLRIGCEDCFD